MGIERRRRPIDRYTCNRCFDHVDTEDPPPPGFIYLIVDQGVHVEDRTEQLCRDCSEQFHRFMAGVEIPRLTPRQSTPQGE